MALSERAREILDRTAAARAELIAKYPEIAKITGIARVAKVGKPAKRRDNASKKQRNNVTKGEKR
jgi:hypothetical protein